MPLPTNLAKAHALILRQREELAAAEARASGAEALIAYMKLVIAKLRRAQYGQSSERGRFIWPSPSDGVVAITAAQLAYMLDGIDWRNPVFTWRPEVAG